MCFVIIELLCRQSRVQKSQVQLANLAIYLCDNRDPMNRGHLFFFVFHFELTLCPTASSQKFQLEPPLSTGKNIERESVQQHYETRRRKNWNMMTS